MNIARPIFHFARTQPDATSIIDGDRTVTYRQLAEAVSRSAGHLRALGIAPGERIGVRLGDSADHLVLLLAAAAMGAVFTPLDWRARPADALRQMAELGLRVALVESDSGLTDPRCVSLDATWHAAASRAAPLDRLRDDADAPFSIATTSGTTGGAKPILQTHLQYHFGIVSLAETMPHGRRYLSSLPLYFGSGRRKCLFHLTRGETVVLLPPLASAAEYVDAVRRHRTDVGAFMPATMRHLLDLAPPGRPLLPEMGIACGGATMTGAEKRDAARRLTPHFYEQFATAATGTIAMLRPGDIADHADSVGRTHSYGEIEIVDEDDRRLPANETGRLRFRGPATGSGVAAGGAWEAANEGFRGDWYYTGDLAALDPQGYLYLKGRLAETISRGGSKIHPVEVENRLLEHPMVADAAVIGRAAHPGEEDIVAFVVLREPVGPGELIAHCRTGLTPYKVPGEIRVIAAMPKNRANKIDKAVLRALLTVDT